MLLSAYIYIAWCCSGFTIPGFCSRIIDFQRFTLSISSMKVGEWKSHTVTVLCEESSCWCLCVFCVYFIPCSFTFVSTFIEWYDNGINFGMQNTLCVSAASYCSILCHHVYLTVLVCMGVCMSDWLHRNHRSGFIMHQKLILLSPHSVVLFKVCYATQPAERSDHWGLFFPHMSVFSVYLYWFVSIPIWYDNEPLYLSFVWLLLVDFLPDNLQTIGSSYGNLNNLKFARYQWTKRSGKYISNLPLVLVWFYS